MRVRYFARLEVLEERKKRGHVPGGMQGVLKRVILSELSARYRPSETSRGRFRCRKALAARNEVTKLD